MTDGVPARGRSGRHALRPPGRPTLFGVLGVVLAGAALLPFASLFVLAGGDSSGVWPHLAANVLPRASATTLALLAGTGLLAAVIGTATAWIVTRWRFPGRNLLSVLLVLPLAVPPYVAAYCWVELLDATGPVQSGLRALTGWRGRADYWFPEIRSLPGAIVLMGFVLYPYVYLTCRLVFTLTGASVLAAGRMLGAGPWRLFREVALPLARPAVVAGAALAMMEALNDIGAVEILGVRSLTFAVFDTWLNRSSLPGAAQLSAVMLAVVAVLLLVEARARGERRYVNARDGATAPRPSRLRGLPALAAALACAVPVAIGFLAPAGLMLVYALRRLDGLADPQLLQAAGGTLVVATGAALTGVAGALVLVTLVRRAHGLGPRLLARAAMLGYAVPGSVLAIGVLHALAGFDNWFDGLAREHLGLATGLLLSGSAFALIYACSVRFLALAHGALVTGYTRLSDHVAMAARTLGRSADRTLLTVELPLLRQAILTGSLLVFVESAKELSATLLLRPFGFSTLATFVYERASRAVFPDAALAGLMIVALGAVPALVLALQDRARG